MKKILISSLALAGLLLVQTAQAAQVSDILTAMTTARESLVKMLTETDVAKRDALKAEVVKGSEEAETALTAVLADAATVAETKTKLEEVKTLWEEFKTTRDSELIPNLEAGKLAEAKALATGIQKERFGKLKELLEGLK